MKRLMIEVELSDAAAGALAFPTAELEQLVEDALVAHIESDCRDTDWGEDVKRLFGFREADVADAIRVTGARIVGEAGA